MPEGKRGYQRDFAQQHAAMYSNEGRARKAETMRLILADVFGDRLAHTAVLNVGWSTGIIDAELAPAVGSILGVDIDQKAIEFAERTHRAPNLSFRVGDAMAIDSEDATFDVVICSQVYEHVPDAERLMAEIERVLRPGGVCYFAATNRLSLIEQHYHLPFLSIIPVSCAHAYLRLLRRGSYYYERHLTYWQLRRLVRHFRVEDITPRMLEDPARYATNYLFPGHKLAIARIMSKVAYWAFPGYIWLLWKLPVSPDRGQHQAFRTTPSGADPHVASRDHEGRPPDDRSTVPGWKPR